MGKLVSVQLTSDMVDAVMEQVGDVLRHHVKRINGTQPLAEQMKSLALDAYTQGLLDGAQVGAGQRDIRSVILGEAA